MCPEITWLVLNTIGATVTHPEASQALRPPGGQESGSAATLAALPGLPAHLLLRNDDLLVVVIFLVVLIVVEEDFCRQHVCVCTAQQHD